MQKWTTADMGSQKGKNVIITGVGGLGFETALALAKAGAKVIIAGRDIIKGDIAVNNIRIEVPGAEIYFELMDLADLNSIASFSKSISNKLDKLDIIINNAGVMTPPKRLETKDKLELQFGTNYLSHFALTAHLLPLLKIAQGRVISLGSIAARGGKIHFDDLQAEAIYNPMSMYAQSKLACVMFAAELQAQSDRNAWGITSIAAHPGISRTELFVGRNDARKISEVARKYAWFLFQPAAQGALPVLFAATSANAEPGKYYGPHAFGETRGYPLESVMPKTVLDKQSSERLWDISAELAGVTYN